MRYKKEVIQFTAILMIELLLFLPFYVADVYADDPAISNILVNPTHNYAEVTWQTDIDSNSLVDYGDNTLIELSKTSSQVNTQHSILLGPLSTNTKYYYRVKSCSGADCSSSAISDFNTLEAPAPGKITGLTNLSLTTTSVELNWEESNASYFGQYSIYRNNQLIANISSKSITSYLDEGLDGASTHQYQISATNINGIEGEKSDSVYMTTLIPDTIAPVISNVSIVSLSTTSVTIEWKTDESSDSKIEYGPSQTELNGSDISQDYTTEHSVTINNLQNASTYYYKVISCDTDDNCAENFGEAFTPTEIVSLDIQMNVPTIYNSGTVPVNGTVTPHTKVRFFVNNIYKGLIGVEKNTNGEISFNVPGFVSGNNTLTIRLEDSIGSVQEQSYEIDIDLSPPNVVISDLPTTISSETVSINGTTNEAVDVKVYLTSTSSVDTTAPSQVTNFHSDTVQANSVELSWVNINDSDFYEYYIYRDNILIGTAVSSPYADDYLVSSGVSYNYEIASVDTSCNIGNKLSLNILTTEGGLTYNETPEGESTSCDEYSVDNPDYELSEQYPSFTQEINLNQGNNQVLIKVSDKAGNTLTYNYNVFYDSEAPEITETNLDSLSPSYIRDVTITGSVTEDSYVCVYINSQVDVSSYRASEVNDTLESGTSRFCENTQNKTFSIDVELRRDAEYAYDTDTNTDNQASQMIFSTGTAWTNDIRIVATDRVGLQGDPVEEEILYALCGSGGDWSVIVNNILPTEIVPRHLLEGMAQVGVTLDLSWRGSGDKPGVSDIDIREGYPMGMSSDLESRFDSDWISGLYDSWSDEYDQGYVMIDLRAQDDFPENWTTYQKEDNLSHHNVGQCFNVPFTDTSYIASAGCVRVPLTLIINYDRERTVRINNQNEIRSESITQKECIDVEVLIQPRIDPDIISDSFLESSVDFLNATIELIDTILDPLENILQSTMIACFGLWVILYVKTATEGFSCWGVDIDNDCSCAATESGLECTGDKEDDCKSCLDAKINTKRIEKLMAWTCDRIMCPAVPSYEKYIKDNQDNAKSNCYGKELPTSEDYKKDLADDGSCKYHPTGLVGEIKPIARDVECCDEEYLNEWGPGCVVMNELKESNKLANPEEDTTLSSAWRTISDFKLCRPGDNDERQINIDGQWFIMNKTVGYDQLDDEKKEETFEWEVFVGTSQRVRTLSNGNVVNDSSSIEKILPALTGTKIIREDCRKYGVEDGYEYPDGFFWPEYTKSINTEKTTDNPVVPSTLTNEQTMSKVGKQRGDLGNKETIEVRGVNYNYDAVITDVDGEEQITSYKLVDGNDYDIENGKVSLTLKDTSQSTARTSKLTAPVPETIVREACSGFAEDYIVNPTDSIFRSIQCACISALYSYLKMYRKILGLVRDCFQTILLTGDGSSGVCQAVLSYYVCDLLYYLFSCFSGYSGFGSEGTSDGGIIGFFTGIVGAGAEVQDTVQNRYGDTNMFRVMFVEKKIVHAACMAFFGADVDIDLTAMAEQAMEIPIDSTIAVMPATRRFVGYNPIDGITNHVYHIGMMVVSGSDNMRYDAYLLCSTDNQCDSRYFDGGLCDCAHNGVEITKDITNSFGGNGRLSQGEIINEEAYIPMSYADDNSRIRYDKVRIVYSYIDNTGQNKEQIVEKELGQVGSEPLASCSFDGGAYRCQVFGEPTTACIIDGPDIEFENDETEGNSYYNVIGKDFRFDYTARKETTTGDTSKIFFAVFEIKDDENVLISKQMEVDSTSEETLIFKNIKVDERWFGGGSYYTCYKESGGEMNAEVSSCADDATITCRKEGGVVKFNIVEKSNNNRIACNVQENDQARCGDRYVIEIGSLNSVDCTKTLQIDRRLTTDTSTTVADEKTLDYSLTIYRPKTGTTNTKSDTVAKCNGNDQINEGQIKIVRGSTTGSSDTTNPSVEQSILTTVVRRFEINEGDSVEDVGVIPVEGGKAKFEVFIQDMEPNGAEVEVLKKSSVKLKIGDQEIELMAPTYMDNDFTEYNINKKINVEVSVSKNSAQDIDLSVQYQGSKWEPNTIEGVWFGQSCGSNNDYTCTTSENVCNGFNNFEVKTITENVCPTNWACCGK